MVSWYWMLAVGIICGFFVWYQTKGEVQKSPKLSPEAREELMEKGSPEADVLAEEEAARTHQTDNMAMTALNVEQTFDQETLILDDVSLSVKERELCVLLGPNGAGKTTLMSVLVGDLNPSEGSSTMAGSEEVVPGSVGICPQFDALFGTITVGEQCRVVEHLKGLRRGAILPYMRQLDMIKYMNTKVRNLSGGNRRKVSLALAMVGKPNCLVLDEPSTGVDPASRRLLWDVLKAQPQAILLSTHVMEEAEALATKIVIQMRGRIQVVGSVEDLIYRFCKHLTLSFRSPLAGVAEEVCEKIGGDSSVKEQQGNLVEIEIPLLQHDMAEVMADLFTMMEAHKTKWQVDQYSIAQATLNTVFLDLARRPVRVPRWHKRTTTMLTLPTQQWTKDRMGTKSLDNPKGSVLPTPRGSLKSASENAVENKSNYYSSASNSKKSSAVSQDEKTKYYASEKKD